MAFMREIPAEIRAEAAAWLARLRADDRNSSDEAAFRDWLACDPQHAQAFEAMTEIWEIAGAAWQEPVASAPRPQKSRRVVLGGIGALAAASVSLAFFERAKADIFETGVGEQKHAVLPDGTQVFLDTDTKIHASYDNQMRVVALDRGRCNFHVMESDARPFVVDAAEQRIVAARTSFDVRREGNDVCVVLTQGSAKIGRRSEDTRQTLRSGDRFISNAAGTHKDRPNLTPLLAWQTGQAIFDNETVAGAVSEMNRYSVTKIAIGDAEVAKMRISGVYRVGDNVAFAHSIATLLPAIMIISSDQVRLELDTARTKRT